MDSISSRRVQTCTADAIWDYELPRAVAADLAEHMEPIGALEQPIPTTPLYRLETGDTVVLATAGESRVRLRVKASADVDEVRPTFERCLARYLADAA
jgi:hypothetical protein